MSYFKEAEQIHNSQNLSEFCRLKQTKVNCVKSLAPATLVVESSYPYHCLQFTVDPRFFITLVYYVLYHLCLLWKIAVCYFLLVIQCLLFLKIVVDVLFVILTHIGPNLLLQRTSPRKFQRTSCRFYWTSSKFYRTSSRIFQGTSSKFFYCIS